MIILPDMRFRASYVRGRQWRPQLQAGGRGLRELLCIRYRHEHGCGAAVRYTLCPQVAPRGGPLLEWLMGRIHCKRSFSVTAERLTDSGRLLRDRPLHLHTATYKDDALAATSSAVEQGHPAKPLGVWWLRVGYDRHANRLTTTEMRAT